MRIGAVLRAAAASRCCQLLLLALPEVTWPLYMIDYVLRSR
jgi:hypothetical protein